MKLVVGLGNPGSKYSGTRHNVGFEVIDCLAGRLVMTAFRNKFESQVAETTIGGVTALLAKPQTYMNLSGRAVRQIMDFYKLPLNHLLIICDDFHLPLGKLRVRAKGSHGGQNGLRSIEQYLGSDQYARLRVGVGSPTPGNAIDFVLSRFAVAELPVIDEAIQRASDGVQSWVMSGLDACAASLNSAK